jgi:hypothetical protein
LSCGLIAKFNQNRMAQNMPSTKGVPDNLRL